MKVIDEKNVISKINLNLPEFEVFKCKRKDIIIFDDMKKTRKRSICEPISFLFNTKQYECFFQNVTRSKGINLVLNLSPPIFKLSYKDIIELLRTMNDQNEILKKSKEVRFKGLKLRKSEMKVIL